MKRILRRLEVWLLSLIPLPAVRGGAAVISSVAAATAVVGYDLLRDKPWRVAGRPRRLLGVALTGSAAVGDSAADVMVGNTKVGELYNNATGFPTRDHLFGMGGVVVPAGETIAVIVTDAPATNPLNVMLDII
jgi:hypothetical protein